MFPEITSVVHCAPRAYTHVGVAIQGAFSVICKKKKKILLYLFENTFESWYKITMEEKKIVYLTVGIIVISLMNKVLVLSITLYTLLINCFIHFPPFNLLCALALFDVSRDTTRGCKARLEDLSPCRVRYTYLEKLSLERHLNERPPPHNGGVQAYTCRSLLALLKIYGPIRTLRRLAPLQTWPIFLESRLGNKAK